MAHPLCLPETFKIVSGTAGIVTTDGGVICDYVSLKNVLKAWIVLQFLQAADHATVVNPQRATLVDGTGAIATPAVNWWLNPSIITNDTLVAQTASATPTLTASGAGVNELMVIQVDPAAMGATYDVMGCIITTSGQATNFVSVVYYLLERYQQATPPTAVLD